MTLQELMYKLQVWEFMSSLVMDMRRTFQGGVGYIRFQLFNQTFEMKRACFNELFRLPNHGVLAPVYDDYSQGSFWFTITY